MKLLMLFLAFFLSFLPESDPVATYSQTQEAYWEDVVDFEEEIVIKTVRREQIIEITKSVFQESFNCRTDIVEPHPVDFWFERQWLTHCRLRL
ncbi:MAG: hypothetical protein K6G53_09900 [Bacteroidales bacterium]|nr:hypothetical protein [Bacteroidales bacterium]